MNKENAVQKSEDFTSKLNLSVGEHGIILRSYDEMVKFSATIAKSGLCPKAYHEKPNDIFVALQMGFELGIKPMQALQNIAVVNGTPSIWGDAVPGLVIGSGKEDWNKIEQIGQKNSDGSYPDNFGYKYTSKRIGREEPHSITFTVGDARRAGLWGKIGTWKNYPDRMLHYRARTFCYRDLYPDVLKGLHTIEEMRDVQNADYEVIDSDKPRTEALAETLSKQTGNEPETNSNKDMYNAPEDVDYSDVPAVETEIVGENEKETVEPIMINQKQITAIYAKSDKDYGLKHDDTLRLASAITKRSIISMAKLTKKETSFVIDTLEHPETVKGYLDELAEYIKEIKREETKEKADLFDK